MVPAELRRRHGIEAGARVRFLEDQFGRIVFQPITEEYVDRVMGCLAGGSDLLAVWERASGGRQARALKTDVLDASGLFTFLQYKPGALKVGGLMKEAIRGRAAILMRRRTTERCTA